MTDNNDKIRALVLAALMVFSVFAGTIAFAGTAAAVDGVSHDTDDLPDSADDGSSATGNITFNVTNVSNSGDTVTADVNVTNGEFTSLNNAEVTADNGSASVEGSASVTNDGNLTVDITTDMNNTDVSITFEGATVEYDDVDGDTDAQFSAFVSDDGDGSTASSDLFVTSLTDTSTADQDAAITNGSVIYQGETVEATGFNESETVNLYQGEPGDSTFRNTYDANADGVVTFPTSDLEASQDYFVRGESSGENASFEVVEHTLTLSVDDTELGNAGGETTTTAEFDSNRRTFDAYVSSDSLSADDIEAIVDDGFTTTNQVDLDGDGTDDSVQVTIERNTEYTLNASGIDPGEYSLDFSVADSTASASTSLNVSDVGAGQAELNSSSFSVEQGNVANIQINLDGAAEGTSGTLVIGDEASEGYQANVSYTDVNADGEVTVMFNTYAAGSTSNGTVVMAAGDDSVTFDNSSNQTVINAILAQGDYTLSVSTASDAATTVDQPQDLGALAIGPRSTESIQLWAAPGNAELDADGENGVTASDLASLIEDDVVTEAGGTVTAGDYAVHQISATGLDGLAQAEGGLDSALLADGGLSLSITQTNPVQNQDPKSVNVSESLNALTFVEGDDAYYVVADTDSLTLESDDAEIAAGDEFEATFTVADDRLLDSTSSDDHESVSTTFTVEQASTTFDSDPVEVAADSGQNITGSTNYAPGTELTVRVRSSQDVSPGFFNTQTVTVQADGTFSAEFDFSEQAAEDTFGVTVRKGGTEVASADGLVVESTSTATMTATATPSDGTDTMTPTETATDEPTDTATPSDDTDTPDESTPMDDDTDTTTTTTPGFGIAVALVALLAAALLAGRRE